MLDFNQAEQQGSGSGRGPIPTDSCVILEMEIRTPRANKQGSHPLLCRSEKGNEYIDVEFKVPVGTFEGRTIWQNFTVAGSEQASKISMRTLRAIIESARGINPSDESPAATAARRLTDWADFQRVRFMAKVEAKLERNVKDGRDYVNNHIKRIITPDMEEYAIVAQHGEIITDTPIPQVPDQQAAPTAGAPAPTWGQPAGKPAGVSAQAAGSQQQTGSASTATSPSKPVPAWAQK